MKLTKAQKALFRQVAENGQLTGTSEFSSAKHRTFSSLHETGLLVWDDTHQAHVLSDSGIVLARELWPDLDVIESGNPFAGKNLGLSDETFEAHRALVSAQERVNELRKAAWSDRQRREAQIALRFVTMVPLLKTRGWGAREPVVTRVVWPGGDPNGSPAYHVEIVVADKRMPASCCDALRVQRFVRSQDDIEAMVCQIVAAVDALQGEGRK